MKLLVEKLKERDKHGFLVELKNLGKNNDIITALINLYCGQCVQDKIEPLVGFYKALAEVQKKKTIDGINTLCKLVYLHYCEGLLDSVEDIDVTGVLYRKQRDIPELHSYRDIVDETIVNLLDILWDLFIQGGSKSSYLALGITKYILEKVSKKQLYKRGVLLSQEKLDVYDLMMNFISHFMECFQFEDPIKKYVKLCKELFYYKCRMKDRPWRVRIIYACVYVLSKRTLNHLDDHETEDVVHRMKKKSSYEYLKVITRINTNLINEVRSQKQNANAPIYYAKSIDVSGFDHVSYLNTCDRRPTVVVNKNLT